MIIEGRSLVRAGAEKLAWITAASFVSFYVYSKMGISTPSARVTENAWNALFNGGVDPNQKEWGQAIGTVLIGATYVLVTATITAVSAIYKRVIDKNN